jgi:hypothetical protein
MAYYPLSTSSILILAGPGPVAFSRFRGAVSTVLARTVGSFVRFPKQEVDTYGVHVRTSTFLLSDCVFYFRAL